MRRISVFMLTAVGMLGLSCQVSMPILYESGPPIAHAEAGLPAVSAGPGGGADGANDGAIAARADQAPAPEPSGEKAILAELRSRHTALADHEMIELARAIITESERHDLEPALVMAVIHVESRGYHLAVSPVGALGLMQLMPRTGEELARKLDLPWRGPDSLFDPVLNVKLGTAYLRQLTDRYESTPTALAAYNWGPGRIDRRIRSGAGVPSLYTQKVLKAYDVWEANDRS